MNDTIAERLLDALVPRLNAALPDGFVAESQNGWLTLKHGRVFCGGSAVASLLDQDYELRGLITSAADSVLSNVQDWIAVELTTPWPASAHNLPMPGAAIIGDLLELWYGDKEQPTLRLEPIRISEILGDASS